jgi:hypothetical protein
MDEGAENLEAHGGDRGYYEQIIAENWADQYYIRRMVHAIPGIRSAPPTWSTTSSTRRRCSRRSTLKPEPVLPVIVGVDGGFTPAAVLRPGDADGQLRVLREIALERGGMEELAKAMLVLEARDFRGCDFHTVCDPAMVAGEDKDPCRRDWRDREQRISKGSDRQRLAEEARPQGRARRPATTSAAGTDAVRDKIGCTARPAGYLLDPSCKGLIRGKRETYQFRKLQGSNDLSSVKPTFDTHIADAEQYMAMECGTDAAQAQNRPQGARQGRTIRASTPPIAASATAPMIPSTARRSMPQMISPAACSSRRSIRRSAGARSGSRMTISPPSSR